MATITTEYLDASILTRNVATDTTEYTVSGDGIFDDLMETATKHLKMQFEGNRIREEDYAVAYVDIYKATLQAALQLYTVSLDAQEKEAQIKLIEAQIKQAEAQTELIKQQVEVEKCKPDQLKAQTELIKQQTAQAKYQVENILPAQKANIEQQTKSEIGKEKLYYRQIEGFDENFKEKMLKIQLDAWTVGFSASSDTFYASDNAEKTIPKPMTASEINNVWNTFVYNSSNPSVSEFDSTTDR
jgi:hypothetical protein